MQIVDYDTYVSEKQAFFKKHKNNFTKHETGSSAEHYSKIYTFQDGNSWYEVMTREYAKVELPDYKCKVSVDLFRVEYYNSEESGSKFYYEPWNVRQ